MAAPPDLAPWVDAIWQSHGCGDLRVLPDGCADLIIDLSRANAIAVGTMTRPLYVDDSSNLFGVRFRPGYASGFFGIPLSELTDQRITTRDRGMLAARVVDAHGGVNRVAVVTTALRRVMHDTAPDRRVGASIDAITASGGRAAVEDICRRIGISRQHLARLFAQHVGVAPKMFARIVRFRRALRLARDKRWADLAPELGYFDQSHLIADFREFAGDTPVPFFQSR